MGSEVLAVLRRLLCEARRLGQMNADDYMVVVGLRWFSMEAAARPAPDRL